MKVTQKIYSLVIGIDVAKAKLDIAGGSTAKVATIKYTKTEIVMHLLPMISDRSSTLVVLEATGGYESLLVDVLHENQISKLVGVAPMNQDSGTKQGKRQTTGGRSSVGRVLYMATLVATRYNPAIKKFYVRLLADKKPKKLALVAAMRKLLTIINTLIKNDEVWIDRLAID